MLVYNQSSVSQDKVNTEEKGGNRAAVWGFTAEVGVEHAGGKGKRRYMAEVYVVVVGGGGIQDNRKHS